MCKLSAPPCCVWNSYCKFDKTKVLFFLLIFCVFTGTVIPRSWCKGVEWKYLFTFYFCVQRRNWRKVPWWTKITACMRFLTESETLSNAKLEKQKRETNEFLNSFSLLHVQKTSKFFFSAMKHKSFFANTPIWLRAIEIRSLIYASKAKVLLPHSFCEQSFSAVQSVCCTPGVNKCTQKGELGPAQKCEIDDQILLIILRFPIE